MRKRAHRESERLTYEGVRIIIADHPELLRDRLVRGAALLSVIDTRREITGSAELGSSIERGIVERELRDLDF